jgi:hypothetical protein
MNLSRLWDTFCCDCGTDLPADASQTACKNERQDYAARFGVSSERFVQLFETAFPQVT